MSNLGEEWSTCNLFMQVYRPPQPWIQFSYRFPVSLEYIGWERFCSNIPTLCLGSMVSGLSDHQLAEYFENIPPNLYVQLILYTTHPCNLLLRLQGEPSGLALAFVAFDLRVPPCCRDAMPIRPTLQLPKQSCAHSGSSEIKVNKTLCQTFCSD